MEKYIAEKVEPGCNDMGVKSVYSDADFAVIVAHTNVYSTKRIDVTTLKSACFAHFTQC